MQAPKIDNRTFLDLVAQAETLAEIATDNQWRSGAAEYVAAENLAGRVLDQDIVARIVAPAGITIDVTLAEQLHATPGLRSVMLQTPDNPTLAQQVVLPDEHLPGRTLAEDVVVWVSQNDPGDGAEQKIILARGTFVSEEQARRVLALAPAERIRVRAQPLNRAGDMGGALMRVFGRFAELLIDRLNQVPDKHFLIFLNLIGVGLLPPRPARAPVQFRLVTGSPIEAVVPAGTRIAAPPLSGEDQETVFETERDLVVTRAQLVDAYTRDAGHDPDHDRYRRVTEQITGLDAAPFDMFAGSQEIEHVVYLACDALLRLPGPANIAIDLTTPDAGLFPQLP
ncbi:MAG TPA: hypothetical protein VFT99_08610, partial [Roseiflexaceae bacterium]|nr:hypothetical protein [Roseiflexaceae bacterium]